MSLFYLLTFWHGSRYVTNLVMLFSLSISAGVFILAVPLLSVLGPAYSNTYMIVWLGIPFHQVFDTILTASEKVDVAKSSFKNYVKSRLFTLSEIALFGNIGGLFALTVVKTTISGLGYSDFSEWFIGHSGSTYWSKKES